MKKAQDLLVELQKVELKEKVNCAVKHLVIDYNSTNADFLWFYRQEFGELFQAYIINSKGLSKKEFLNNMDSEISKRKTEREKTELK